MGSAIEFQSFHIGGVFNPLDFWIFHVLPQYEAQLRTYFSENDSGVKNWIEQENSDLALLSLNDGTCVIKKVKKRRIGEYLRRYIGRSRAELETKSSLLLEDAGINVPQVYGYGVNYSPFGQYESIFLCKYLERFKTVYEYLDMGKPASYRKRDILRLLCQDVAKMHQFGIFRRDCNRGNIMIDPDDLSRLFWIDNWAWQPKRLTEVQKKNMLKQRRRDNDTAEDREWLELCYRDAVNHSEKE